MIGRRDILKGAAATAALTKVSFAFAQDKPKPRTRIVFLGTKGGPRVTTGRSNPASVLLVNGTPYVSNCNLDTAGDVLKTLYGSLNAKNAGTLGGSFVNFDQAVFWGNFDPTTHGMASDGWAYVPANCAAGAVQLEEAGLGSWMTSGNDERE